MAEKRELKYRFHITGTPEQTAELILKVFMQANRTGLKPMSDHAELPEAAFETSILSDIRCSAPKQKGLSV